MIASELIIAGVLLFIAEQITKRKHKVSSTNDSADA